MNDVATSAPAKDRPVSTAITHASPLILTIMLPFSLLATLLPRHSLADFAASAAATLITAAFLLAQQLHGGRPCARCLRIGENGGSEGASKRQVFLRAYHIKKVLLVALLVAALGGISLTVLMGTTGHEQHALWPQKTGLLIAQALWATVVYGCLTHFAFAKWCPVGEPHPPTKTP